MTRADYHHETTTITIHNFVCECGHEKRSHRPHGGRRVPLTPWVCRKTGCDCREYVCAGTVQVAVIQ